MSVHVRFESDKDTKEAVYNLVQLVSKNGHQEGEQRGHEGRRAWISLFIVLAEDINRPSSARPAHLR